MKTLKLVKSLEIPEIFTEILESYRKTKDFEISYTFFGVADPLEFLFKLCIDLSIQFGKS